MTALQADIVSRQGSFEIRARFRAPDDGITVLFGPSGSGKSSLLALLAGLRRPDSGRILLGTRVCADERTHLAPHRRGIGMVFQDARLFPHLSVRQNIAFAWKRAPVATRLDIGEAADFFDIAALLDRPVTNLSGGEKSRVALARALVSRPDFLLLDEPFAALDGARRRAFMQTLLRLHRAHHLPMMIVTHSIDDAAALGSYLVALRDGTVVASGPFAQASALPEFQSLLDPQDTGRVIDAASLRARKENPGRSAWLRADHVLLATEPPRAISARNLLEGKVRAMSRESDTSCLVELQTSDGSVLSRVTPEAAVELGLGPGKAAWALVKAHAI